MIGTGGSAVRSHHPDYVIAIVIAALLAIGLVMMYSISPILSHSLPGTGNKNYYFMNQIKYVVLGLIVWITISNIDYRKWRDWAPKLLGVAIIALLLLMVPGISHSQNGATRWIGFGSISVQPAEILKIALILYLAVWFEKRQDELGSLLDGVVPFMIMVGVACFVIVVLQRDMGTAMVLAFAAVGVFFTAGMRWRHFIAVVAAGAAAAWAAVILFPHRLSRIMTFIDPSKAVTGQGYQINQALIAIGSGGIAGLGLGHSIQVYGYLPEAANDSIFAIIGEEFGLIGALAIIALFGILVYRGLEVARTAPDMFSRLVATGISLLMLFQAIINIGAMLALVPLTGIPLPFISYGGTSLVVSLFAAGILLNISKYTVREASDANSRQRRGDSRSYLANPGNQRRVKVAR
jgi:cell division protein FtsW